MKKVFFICAILLATVFCNSAKAQIPVVTSSYSVAQHVVTQGESLHQIARFYHETFQQLVADNGSFLNTRMVYAADGKFLHYSIYPNDILWVRIFPVPNEGVVVINSEKQEKTTDPLLIAAIIVIIVLLVVVGMIIAFNWGRGRNGNRNTQTPNITQIVYPQQPVQRPAALLPPPTVKEENVFIYIEDNSRIDVYSEFVSVKENAKKPEKPEQK